MHFLLLILVYIPLTACSWVCPTETLGNGTQSGQFPEGADTMYPAAMMCNISIAVPKGYYMMVTITSKLTSGDNCKIYDDVGTVFTDFGNVSTLLWTAAPKLYIQLTTVATGTFNISWGYSEFTTKPYGKKYQNVQWQDKEIRSGLFVPHFDTYSYQVVVKSNESIAIYGDDQTEILFEQQNLQNCFVFAGEGTNGEFLGSLYSLATSKQPIIYKTAPYTITLVSYSFSSYSGGYLIQTLSTLQEMDFSFMELDDWPFSQNFTLSATDKPRVLTVLDPNLHYGCFLYPGSFSTHVTSLDWLAGAYLPPTAPNLHFNQDTAIIPPKIPGNLKTFVVQNGTITFTLSSNYPNKLQNLAAGDVAYFATENYNLQSSDQSLYESCFIGKLAVGIATFEVQKAYARFNITVTDGQVDTHTLSSTERSVTFAGKGFRIIYMGSHDLQDTGGLLKMTVTSSATGSPLFLTLLIATAFIKYA